MSSLRVGIWLLGGPLLLGALCDTPLTQMQVAQFPGPTCTIGTYTVEANLGQGWFEPDFLVGKVPPFCVAFPKGVTVGVRAYCRSDDGTSCLLEGEGKNCVLADVGTCTEPCSTMLDHRGGSYPEEELATWNVANCGG